MIGNYRNIINSINAVQSVDHCVLLINAAHDRVIEAIGIVHLSRTISVIHLPYDFPI